MCLAWLVLAVLAQSIPAPLQVTPSTCRFGSVVAGPPVTCAFAIRNDGPEPVRIVGADLARPLRLPRTPALIGPGQTRPIVLELPTESLDGPYEGALTLKLADGRPDLVLTAQGTVRQPMAFLPAAAFFVAGHAGERASQSIEIVNQEPRPVEITEVSAAPDGADVRLETIEKGQRYRLTLTLGPSGPIGQHATDLVIRTTSSIWPTWTVRASTWRRPRVYTFPDTVDMGAIPLSQLASAPERFAQTLMIYQRGGASFEARFSVDHPALSVTAARGPAGDRYQATLSYRPDALAPGPVSAVLVIETNDPEFPRVAVPVRGAVLKGE